MAETEVWGKGVDVGETQYRRPIVAYIRVSTEMQDLETQRLLIERWAQSKGVTIDEWYYEIESGAVTERREFQRLWQRVKEGRVGTVVVVELSRLARNMRTLVDFVYEALERGVHIVSIREQWVEDALRNELTRPIFLGVFGVLYELERKMISERTKAGMERAKAQGKHVGRPPALSERDIAMLIEMYKAGVPVSRIARRLGIARGTVYDYLRKLGLRPSKKQQQ